MSASAYRPDIDGLRCLAVLSVVIYHANPGWIPGGYVGVDIFFVISGFLITRLIMAELRQTGRFRFGNFYLRRVRRLLPALLATAILPDEMKDFGSALVAAVLSYSNIHFWMETGYFDAEAATKPLLNTWSLSVEEQFYLVWPALLTLVALRLQRTVLIGGIVVIILGCLALTQWLFSVDPAAAFYLLPTRVPELGIGAVLALAHLRIENNVNAAILGLFGVLAIVISLFVFDDATTFPGINALLPCLGTAALLAAGPNGPMAAFFKQAPLVWVGKISYSVYLVHWPVIVFHGRLTEYHGVLLPGWALVVFSIALGWLQYRLIEQRFRYSGPDSWPPKRFAVGIIAAVLLTIAPGAAANWDKGHQWRIPLDRSQHTNREWFKIEQRRYCRQFNASMDPKLVTCQLSRGAARDLFIWGDSHALHFVAGFAEHYPDHNVFVFYYGGCVAQSGFAGYVRDYKDPNTEKCIAHNEATLNFLRKRPPSDIVVIGPERIAPATREITASLQQAGHTVALLGDTIRPGISINNCASVPGVLVSDEQVRESCVADNAIAKKELDYNRTLASLIPELILLDDVQCPNGECRFHDDNGTLLFRDYHHLNVPGAIHFVGLVKPRLPF